MQLRGEGPRQCCQPDGLGTQAMAVLLAMLANRRQVWRATR